MAFPAFQLDRGDHRNAYRELGAHRDMRDGAFGVRFAVWAPRAQAVSVVGNWNEWRGTEMHRDVATGIWHGFVANIGHFERYKYAITPANGDPTFLKADPFAFAAEVRPMTASRVWFDTGYQWGDHAWLSARARVQSLDRPIAIYECHLGSWQRSPETPHLPLGYRDLAHLLAPYLRDLGYTHLEIMPITEYPFDRSWGYQATGYFAPTARYGSPDDFRYFVDYLHQSGIGVILDWVPAHFCKDAHGLGRFDGEALFEPADPVRAEHHGWGTWQFDFGRAEVRGFLLSSALFWLETFHLDGLRVDAVGSMIWLDHGRSPDKWAANADGTTHHVEAIDFLRRLNRLVHGLFPDVLIFAEEATSYQWVTRRGTSLFDTKSGGNTVSPHGRLSGGPSTHSRDQNVEAVFARARHTGSRGDAWADANTRDDIDAISPQNVITGPPAFVNPDSESLGFDVKWNMGWMNDTLRYIETDPAFRSAMSENLTFPIWYASHERFVLPFSHDEVVHLKRSLLTRFSGDDPARFAGLRALYGYQYGHPGKKLLFMGGEFGQWAEWQEDRSLDWHLLKYAGVDGTQTHFHRGVYALIRDLNQVFRHYDGLHARDSEPDGFEWVRQDIADQGIIAFARKGRVSTRPVVVVCNFSNEFFSRFHLPLPVGGRWFEVLSTDHVKYGGHGLVNPGPLTALRQKAVSDGTSTRDTGPTGNRNSTSPSLVLDVPPRTTLFLARRPMHPQVQDRAVGITTSLKQG